MEPMTITELAATIGRTEAEIEAALRLSTFIVPDPIDLEAELSPNAQEWLVEFFARKPKAADSPPIVIGQSTAGVVRCQTVATTPPGSFGMNQSAE